MIAGTRNDQQALPAGYAAGAQAVDRHPDHLGAWQVDLHCDNAQFANPDLEGGLPCLFDGFAPGQGGGLNDYATEMLARKGTRWNAHRKWNRFLATGPQREACLRKLNPGPHVLSLFLARAVDRSAGLAGGPVDGVQTRGARLVADVEDLNSASDRGAGGRGKDEVAGLALLGRLH